MFNQNVFEISSVSKSTYTYKTVNGRSVAKGGQGGWAVAPPPQSFDNPFLKMLKSG